MNEERRRILDMLAEGKIKSVEAEQLLDAITRGDQNSENQGASTPPKPAKYLRVVVLDEKSEHGGKVNVRVPLSLIRAGVKLAALLPHGVNDHINKALRENGIDVDVSQIKPENLEEIVQHLNDLSVDVEGNRGEKVRVFCE